MCTSHKSPTAHYLTNSSISGFDFPINGAGVRIRLLNFQRC
jgi:hypothetical protein